MAVTPVYTGYGTPLTFGDSGQSAVLTMQNVAAAAGRISAQYDRGAGSIPTDFLVVAKFEKGVAGVVGHVIPIYVARGDGTFVEGNVGTVDAALTAAQAAGLLLVGSVYVNTTSTNTAIVGVFVVNIATRYFSAGYINSATGLLRNTANSCVLSFTPIFDEIQTP